MGTKTGTAIFAVGLVITAMPALVGCSAGRDAVAPSPGPGRATSPTPVAPVPVKVAFVQDLTDEVGAARAAQSFQAAKLRLANAALRGDLPVTIELTPFDTRRDPDEVARIADGIAGDPAFVGAILAPGLGGQVALGDALDAADVPMLSLSTLGSDLGARGWTDWRRLVATTEEQADVLASTARAMSGRTGVCLLGDATPASKQLLAAAAAELGRDVALRSVVAPTQSAATTVAVDIGAAGCGVVLWSGEGGGGGAVRRQLVEQDLGDIVFIGGDGIKDPGYLSAAGPEGRGTLAACPCVDLSTSTGFAAQRFIQDFQAETGLPPGAFAAEAWDAATMFVEAIRAGATRRAEVRDALIAMDRFDGLANAYAFRRNGELTPVAATIHLFVDRGGRWIPPARG